MCPNSIYLALGLIYKEYYQEYNTLAFLAPTEQSCDWYSPDLVCMSGIINYAGLESLNLSKEPTAMSLRADSHHRQTDFRG